MPRLTIIIPVDKKNVANLDADKVDSGKTSRTFTVPLSPTGNIPITNYWCGWLMDDDEHKKLKKDFDPIESGNKHEAFIFDGDKVTPEEILNTVGLKPITVDFKKAKSLKKVIKSLINL